MFNVLTLIRNIRLIVMILNKGPSKGNIKLKIGYDGLVDLKNGLNILTLVEEMLMITFIDE